MTQPQLDVLIVDDSRDAADSMVMLMGLLGHRAQAAYSGQEALNIVDRAQPLCVMLDVYMPDMNGLELAHKLRKKCGQNLVLIAVTGSQGILAREVFDLVDCHFIKPVSADDLAKVLGSHSAGSSPSSPSTP